MKIPINLASRPYENLRPYYSAAAIAVLVLAILAMLVVRNMMRNRDETRTLTEANLHFENDLQNMDREQRELEKWLARPEVREIRERSAFLNTIIIRKSLSWTQMFMDLEKILPGQVQVTAIRPNLNKEQEAELKLTVSAPTIQPLVELLKDLEASPRFGPPVVDSERYPAEKATDINIVLELSVLYHQAAGVELPSQEEAVVDETSAEQLQRAGKSMTLPQGTAGGQLGSGPQSQPAPTNHSDMPMANPSVHLPEAQVPAQQQGPAPQDIFPRRPNPIPGRLQARRPPNVTQPAEGDQ